MYLTVSIEPSNMDSPTGFLQATTPLNTLTTYPHISLKKLFFLLPPQFQFNRTLQVFLKKVHKISIIPEKPPTHTLR